MLELIANAEAPPSLEELTRASGLPKPTVHRILGLLARGGLVQREAFEKRYVVGARVSALSLAVQMLAFSEGVLLAEKRGIPREKAVEVMLASVIASPMVAYRGPLVLGHPEEVWFDCHMMQKDMNLALELGRELDVPLPTTAVTNELLSAANGMGIGGRDFAVLFDVLASMAGVRTEILEEAIA